MASIQKHGDKWRVQVYKNGVRKSAVWGSKRQAQEWAVRTEAELSITKGSANSKTFGQAVTLYTRTVSSQKVGDSPAWEGRRFEAMQEFFGETTPLAKITSERIGQWRDHRLETVSGSTIQREANLLRHMFTLAVDEWRWLERNPFKGVRLPKHNPARQAIWGWREIRRVLRAPRVGKTLETIQAFHVALHTAMRLGEVLGAKVEGKVAVLPSDKTTRGPVKVPLARKGAKLLKAYGPFTVDANEASVLFSKLCGELLIEGLTFHDSRATALTLLARRVDVLTLARISRHRDLKILMNTYYRESAEQIAARL